MRWSAAEVGILGLVCFSSVAGVPWLIDGYYLDVLWDILLFVAASLLLIAFRKI